MILIKSGTLITAEKTFQADILVDGEQIVDINPNLDISNLETIDATGKYIMPGGVDPHTHFDLPMFDTVSSDDHYTGHKAAAFGGTTTVIDFVPQPEAGTLKAGIAIWHSKADSKAAIDFGFHMNITRLDDGIAAEIPSLIDQGISTLKVFMAYNGRLRLQDVEIQRVLELAGRHGMLTMLHAESGDEIDKLVAKAIEGGHTSTAWHARTRPASGAIDAVSRAVKLAENADAPLYIVHMNTQEGLLKLLEARVRGVSVMGETCPQYLFFTEDELSKPDGAKWVCSPPLRTDTDMAAFWQALDNDELHVIGSDHCPFFYDGTKTIVYEDEQIAIPGKELGINDFTKIPNGLPMVGDRLPILWTYGVNPGKISPNQFVALTSTNPAKIFGLYPQKGALEVGSDADIVIWDPDKKVTYGISHSQHRTDYNLFEGWNLKGFPEIVMLRGKVIVDKGRWNGKRGMGRFLPRKTAQFI